MDVETLPHKDNVPAASQLCEEGNVSVGQSCPVVKSPPKKKRRSKPMSQQTFELETVRVCSKFETLFAY